MIIVISLVLAIIAKFIMLVEPQKDPWRDKRPLPNEEARKILQDGLQNAEKVKILVPEKEPTIVPEELTHTNDMPRLKNIASNVSNPLEWFVCDRKDLPGPSPAEQLIIEALNRYKVRWYREVSFTGLQINKWSYPRYDIMIEVPNSTGIHICEYDGKLAHSTPDRIAVDKLKDQFCHKHRIPITRWSAKHYYKLHECVASLMMQYNIQPKIPGIRVGR